MQRITPPPPPPPRPPPSGPASPGENQNNHINVQSVQAPAQALAQAPAQAPPLQATTLAQSTEAIRALGLQCTVVGDNMLLNSPGYEWIPADPEVLAWTAEFIGKILGPHRAAPFLYHEPMLRSDWPKAATPVATQRIVKQLALGLKSAGLLVAYALDPLAAYGFVLEPPFYAIFCCLRDNSRDLSAAFQRALLHRHPTPGYYPVTGQIPVGVQAFDAVKRNAAAAAYVISSVN